MKTNRKIAYLGIGIGMYVVLSAFVIIPIINRIKLDLGYIVFGIYLNHFGITASIVGVFGCIIANLLKGGSLPIAWAAGQLFVGLVSGYLLPKTEKTYLKMLIAVVTMLIGIVGIKSALEIMMFHYPVIAKVSSNAVAFIADVIPLLIGIALSKKMHFR